MLTATCHSEASGWTAVDDLDRLSDLRAEDGNLLWAEADVSGLTTEDMKLIAQEFELDPFAVEDALRARQRPKFESYGVHHFLVMHQLDEINAQLEAVQLACFIGRNFVLTLHHGAARVVEEAKRRWRENPPAEQHPAQLLHTLVDSLVDDFQVIADRVEHRMEELEERALDDPRAPIQHDLYSVKQQVARLRRYVFPSSRIIEWAVDPDSERQFSHATAMLFRDVQDHLMRIVDQVRNVDELSQGVLDLTQAAKQDALNEVNKKLAAWAAILGYATVVGGIYGMNFSLVPPTDTRFGFWFALTLMATGALALYAVFKKKDWI